MTSSPKLGRCVITLLAPDVNTPSLVRRGADAIRHNMIWSPDAPPGVYLMPGDGDLRDRLRFVGLRDPEATVVHSDSGASEGTTYSPIILPVTGREKEDDIKVRNLASAWEQAPPEDGTSITLDSIIDEIVNVPEKFPKFYYFMLISMKRDSADLAGGRGRLVDFSFLVDTGSNTTWTFAKHVWQLLGLRVDTHPATLTVGTGDRIPAAPSLWNMDADNADFLTPVPPCIFPAGDTKTFQSERPYPHIIYGASNHDTPVPKLAVVLALLKHSGRQLEVRNCIDWNKAANVSWKSDARIMWYRFGVCYAASKFALSFRGMDGLIGMGTGEWQKAFDHRDGALVPSFLKALSSQVVPPSEGQGGYVSYFCLRGGGEHFLALNEWPCSEEPAWSDPIFVLPDQVNSGKWMVQLDEIAVNIYRVGAKSDRIRYKPGRRNGKVFLDTGTSASYFSESVMEKFVAMFSPAQAGTFTVDLNIDLAASSIDLYFERGGGSNASAVNVNLPIVPFVCNSERQGLIFPCIAGETAILGANFFQAAMVALHRPSVSLGRPYIRLAPQWESELDLFMLPPSQT